jgi:hypothetical protein
VFREVVPVTLGKSPMDQDEGLLVWPLLCLLFYTGFIAPGFMPQYTTSAIVNEVNLSSDLHWRELINRQDELNPSETASLFNWITYSYLTPLVWRAYKKAVLEVSDLPPPHLNEKADSVKANALPVS